MLASLPALRELLEAEAELAGIDALVAEIDGHQEDLLLAELPEAPEERAAQIAARVDGVLERLLPVRSDDGLRELGSDRFDVVLTNPPFGKKSSMLSVTASDETSRESITYERDDFWAATTNKQLNFVQHADRRIQLFKKLAAYLKEAFQVNFVVAVLVDGSFVTAKEEPNDIDLVLILRADHTLGAPVRPFEYNVISKRRVRRRHGFDVQRQRQRLQRGALGGEQLAGAAPQGAGPGGVLGVAPAPKLGVEVREVREAAPWVEVGADVWRRWVWVSQLLSADAASGGCAPACDASCDRGPPGGESRASWGAGGWLTPQDRLLVCTPAPRSQGRGRFRVR